MEFNSAKSLSLLGTMITTMLLGISTLSAQTSALGGIAGEVHDSSGAIVPGASVTIINSGTGAKHQLASDAEGHYSVQFLQPGTYEVIVGGGSFGKMDRKGVPVTVGAVTAVDAALPLASVTSEVTVSNEAPLLDTERVEQSQVVDRQIVSNVPVNSRRFESFVLLTPNVIPDGTTGLLSYRGLAGVYNQNIVDGGDNNQEFFGEARGRSTGSPYVFPVDAISEFESSATGYSAELGGAAGGIINAVTKAGTNNLHGDVYEYYRSPGWNALDPLTKYQARLPGANPYLLTQPVKVQNEFGVTVGGPIIKDKLFFHFTYDGFRKVNPIVYFSGYNSATTSIANLAHLCDGGTTSLVDKGVTYPTTIPNISAGQCAAAVTAVNNQLGAYPRTGKQDIFFPRLDYQLGSRTHLSAEFLWEDFHQPNGYNGAATATSGGIGANGTVSFHERFLIANAETQLSSHSANVVHFQWSRDLETSGANQGGPFDSISGLVSFGESTSLPRPALPDEHRWQISEVYSHVIGKHSLKAGFDLNFVHEQIANLFTGSGYFYYSQAATENNFANFIQDAYSVNGTTGGAVRHYDKFQQSVDSITGVGADDFWNQDIDGFAEDSWKVTPKLLIQAGVRDDVQLVPGPDLPNLTDPLTTLYTSQLNPNLKMVQPRLGFNWNVHSGTVIRGGYGLFYGQIYNSAYYNIRRENGVYQKLYTINPVAANAPYASCPSVPCTTTYTNTGSYATTSPIGLIPLAQPPGPQSKNPITGASVTATGVPAAVATALAPLISPHGLDPHYSNPYSHSWDLTVEQELPFHSTLTLGYVGNRAMRLPIFVDKNVDPASATYNHTYQYTNPITGQVINHTQLIYTDALYSDSNSMFTGVSSVNSTYHSMVVTIKKPFAHNVELLANYTWAKAMDGGASAGGFANYGGGDTAIDPIPRGHRQGLGAEYARSDLDVRNRAIVTLTALSKFGFDDRFIAYAVNGWRLSGTYTGQTGEPVTAGISGTISTLTSGSLSQFGKPLKDGGISGAEQFNNSANTSATNNASARVPDWIATRNSFKGPGIHNLDARVSREFPVVHDRYHVEVAAEAFNVVNRRFITGVSAGLVAYTAPGGTGCPTAANNPGTVGCLGSLPSGTAPFMSPVSTSGTIYGARQLQLVGRFIF
jgi:hypothetical protein